MSPCWILHYSALSLVCKVVRTSVAGNHPSSTFPTIRQGKMRNLKGKVHSKRTRTNQILPKKTFLKSRLSPDADIRIYGWCYLSRCAGSSQSRECGGSTKPPTSTQRNLFCGLVAGSQPKQCQGPKTCRWI